MIICAASGEETDMTKSRISVEAPTPRPACVPIIVGRMSVAQQFFCEFTVPSGEVHERTKRRSGLGRDPCGVNLDELLEQGGQVLAGEGLCYDATVSQLRAKVKPERHDVLGKRVVRQSGSFAPCSVAANISQFTVYPITSRSRRTLSGRNNRGTPSLPLYAFSPSKSVGA